MNPKQQAQSYLELCQNGIEAGLQYNEIPFDNFLEALKAALPVRIAVNDNEPINVVAVGSINPISYQLSYDDGSLNRVDDRGQVVTVKALKAGIALADARILED